MDIVEGTICVEEVIALSMSFQNISKINNAFDILDKKKFAAIELVAVTLIRVAFYLSSLTFKR